MTHIHPAPGIPTWSADEAVWWASTLASPIGRRLLERLAAAAPSLPPPGGSAELTAQCAQLVHGYQKAVEELLSMQRADETEVKSPPEAYPDLEDDEKWTTTKP